MKNLPVTDVSHISYSPAISNPKLNPARPYTVPTSAVDTIQCTAMSKNPDYIPSKMLLSLLKCGLDNDKADASLFSGRSYEDWVRMYNLGHENAVTPILLEGLRKTPEIKPPEDVLENMKINEEFVKRYHMHQEKVLKSVIELSSEKGIDTIPIKGLGFSLNYPNPQQRFGGDIDVFNVKHGEDFTKPENNMTYVFDEIFRAKGADINVGHPKHSEFTHHGMPIENHRYFVDVNNNFHIPDAAKVDKYLLKVLNPSEKVLPMGTKVLVPSKEFNNVFLAFHSMTHFLVGGINFHHLSDWAVHIKKNGLHIPDEIKGSPVETFMNAMTALSNKHLGTNIKVPENKKLENAIFTKMLDPRGEYSENKITKPNTKNPLKILRFKYNVLKSEALGKKEFAEFYPKDACSVRKVILNSLKYHLLNPKSLISVLFK